MRIGIYLGLPMWGGGGGSTPPEPPVDWNWQEFDMTAGGDGVQWVGYSTGVDNTPNPPFGSITGEPTEAARLLAFYDDTASGVVLAVFDGEYPTELNGLEVSISGFVLESFETEVVAGNTWVRFGGMPGDWADGDGYEVTFGFDLPRVPAPVFLESPEIYGTPQVNQTLSMSNGVSTDTTEWIKTWLVGGVQAGSGDIYTVQPDDVTQFISGTVRAVGPGGDATTDAAPVGPVAPPNQAPVISGGGMEIVGDDIVFSDATAAGYPHPSVSFQLTRDGVDVTSSRVGDRVSNSMPGQYQATWTASNGIAPDGLVQASVTVYPEQTQIEPEPGGFTMNYYDEQQYNITPAVGGFTMENANG